MWFGLLGFIHRVKSLLTGHFSQNLNSSNEIRRYYLWCAYTAVNIQYLLRTCGFSQVTLVSLCLTKLSVMGVRDAHLDLSLPGGTGKLSTSCSPLFQAFTVKCAWGGSTNERLRITLSLTTVTETSPPFFTITSSCWLFLEFAFSDTKIHLHWTQPSSMLRSISFTLLTEGIPVKLSRGLVMISVLFQTVPNVGNHNISGSKTGVRWPPKGHSVGSRVSPLPSDLKYFYFTVI